jgi:hypothetical protein
MDNLEFLTDVVPRTTTYKKFVEEKGRNFKPGSNIQTSIIEGSKEPAELNGSESPIPSRQHLSLQDLGMNGTAERHDAMEVDDHGTEDSDSHDPIQEQLAMEMADQERMNGNYG